MPQIFTQWQPRYAAVGIPTFPLVANENRKRPLVMIEMRSMRCSGMSFQC